MQTTRIGNLEISRVVFGAMARRNRDPKARRRILDAALGAGITTVDTAPLYEMGEGERWLGEALGGRRGHVVLCTKVGLRWDLDAGDVLFHFWDGTRRRAVRKNGRPESVRWEVHQSLSRLRTDVLDLVQLHHPDPRTPVEDTVGALARLAEEGKIRALGVSNCGLDDLNAARAGAGSIGLASTQNRHHLFDRRIERHIVPWAKEHGVAVLAYSPLAEGLLAGARPEPDLGPGNPLRHPENLCRLLRFVDQVLRPMARAHGCAPAAVALAWSLAQPGIDAALVGASEPGQIAQSAAGGWLDLTAEEREHLNRAAADLGLDPRAGWRRRDRIRRLPRRWIERGRSAAGRAVRKAERCWAFARTKGGPD
jgi:aryl-alcohol dehydrogenase-like predicted oxidoreductase